MRAGVWVGLVAAGALLGAGVGAAPVEWKPPGGGYSVRLPAKPEQKRQVARSPQGTAEVNVCMAREGDLIYLVSHTVYPSAFLKGKPAAKVLQGDRDGFLKSLKAKATRETPVKLGAHPGLEVDLVTPDGLEFRSRFYLAGTRMYQVAFGGPKGSLKAPAGAKYLASFKLVR